MIKMVLLCGNDAAPNLTHYLCYYQQTNKLKIFIKEKKKRNAESVKKKNRLFCIYDTKTKKKILRYAKKKIVFVWIVKSV